MRFYHCIKCGKYFSSGRRAIAMVAHCTDNTNDVIVLQDSEVEYYLNLRQEMQEAVNNIRRIFSI